MTPGQIVGVLLEVEEPFDARSYLTQSSLEGTAKRLGLEWLNWGVWYKEIGPWRLYVDPWEKQPWMEVEVGMDTGNDQIKLIDWHVSQQDADEILPKVVDILIQHQDHNLEHSDNGVGDAVGAVLKPYVVYESDDFDARQFFNDMTLPGQKVADALGFEQAHKSTRKVIGQWVVYLTPGSNYNLVNVYRDYGWQTEPKGQWYLKDEDVERVTTEIVRILQDHTTEQGYAIHDEEAYRKLGAIPQH